MKKVPPTTNTALYHKSLEMQAQNYFFFIDVFCLQNIKNVV